MRKFIKLDENALDSLLKMYPIKLNKVKQLPVFIVYKYQLFRPKPEQLFSKCLNIGNIQCRYFFFKVH